MQPLRSVLSQWRPGATPPDDPLAQIRARWTTIAGEEIAANSRPAELSGGSLLVVTRSSAWSQQLSFLSERIAEAVRQESGIAIERVRFRVGRVSRSLTAVPSRRKMPARKRAKPAERETPTLESAVAHFRQDVQTAQRAKAGAGWKECNRCGIRIVPNTGQFCAACVNAVTAERAAQIARLLFEIPFLGYAGIAEHVDNLTRGEYEGVRVKLLGRWWDALTQLRKSGRTKASRRERDIASSYVLLKTGLDPEEIAPAVVRDLLGDSLYEILYAPAE